ncbi:hypothetical protein BDZ85DRAFT_249937 [Elsinoe ampelina]|uniref:Uncharacterized protein n=1 Tax=Elsinoe ampelina TaxID=302913 RepID=A0A6A6GBC6_9PEZI|nr:hypothetical protein BDZ85DRAFT_249937 [Elsinoe ampelina]
MCIRHYITHLCNHQYAGIQQCSQHAQCAHLASINPTMIPTRYLVDPNVCPTCLSAWGVTGEHTSTAFEEQTPLENMQERDAFIDSIRMQMQASGNFGTWLHDYLLSETMRLVGTEYTTLDAATSAASVQEFQYWAELVRRDPVRYHEAPEWVQRRLREEQALSAHPHLLPWEHLIASDPAAVPVPPADPPVLCTLASAHEPSPAHPPTYWDPPGSPAVSSPAPESKVHSQDRKFAGSSRFLVCSMRAKRSAAESALGPITAGGVPGVLAGRAGRLALQRADGDSSGVGGFVGVADSPVETVLCDDGGVLGAGEEVGGEFDAHLAGSEIV